METIELPNRISEKRHHYTEEWGWRKSKAVSLRSLYSDSKRTSENCGHLYSKGSVGVEFHFPKPQNVSIQIGDRKILIPPSLDKVKREIEDSRYVTGLNIGWDGDAGQPITNEIWNATATFLVLYSRYLYSELSVLIQTPEINPCPNGSLDISWRTQNARMLINIRSEKGKIVAFFYGDEYNQSTIKGSVPVNDVIQEYLVRWMKNLA